MTLQNRILAFLFGFAFQMTLVAMSFVGFLAPPTPFENLVQRFAVLAAWTVLLAGIAAVISFSIILRQPANRNARAIARRAWSVAFLCGVMLCMVSTAMGLAGGFLGPATRWQKLSRLIAEISVLTVAYAGTAFALYAIARSWRTPAHDGRGKAARICAHVILAVVLIMYGVGNFLGSWATGAVFATIVFLMISLGSALDLSTSSIQGQD